MARGVDCSTALAAEYADGLVEAWATSIAQHAETLSASAAPPPTDSGS